MTKPQPTLDDFLERIGRALGALEWNTAELLCEDMAEAYPRSAQTVARVIAAARA